MGPQVLLILTPHKIFNPQSKKYVNKVFFLLDYLLTNILYYLFPRLHINIQNYIYKI